VIRLEGVGKRYVLKSPGRSAFLRRVGGRVLRRGGLPVHWALRDADLEVPEGCAVAVVGTNGSGKSTMLRLIAGIARPTTGQITVGGRVGGVLDLTAGFHMDLSGIENIYLQGALLGIPRDEVRRKLDSILDFAELGDFIHTPVRHYSSGMLLRLAFAITIHTDPQVVLVDEVLAVGDGYFQWKCIREIRRLRDEGRTFLFVTHVPSLAESLCTHAAWVHDGKVRRFGPAAEVMAEYHPFVFGAVLDSGPMPWVPELSAVVPVFRAGSGEVLIREIRLLGADGAPSRVFPCGGEMTIELAVESPRGGQHAGIATVVQTLEQPVTEIYSAEHGGRFDLPAGRSLLRQRFRSLPLRAGTYYLSVGVVSADDHTSVYDGFVRLHTFTVEERTTLGYSRRILRMPASVAVECARADSDGASTAE
jgi:ABC-type polysaccharide/polyol phosphate transport system ATPase subunit